MNSLTLLLRVILNSLLPAKRKSQSNYVVLKAHSVSLKNFLFTASKSSKYKPSLKRKCKWRGQQYRHSRNLYICHDLKWKMYLMLMLLEIKIQFPLLVFLFPPWNIILFQIGNTFEIELAEVSWHNFYQHSS